MFLKTKASFMTLVLICAIFYFSYAIGTAQAQPTSQVCCERTLTGESCSYTSPSNCDPNYNSVAVTCEQTSFCQPGCCIEEQQGQCFPNTPATTCNLIANTTFTLTDPLCQGVQQCQTGCCQLGNQCSLTTQQQCNTLAQPYPELTPNFDPSITSESTCIDVCRAADTGCCIEADGTCDYNTRGQCPTAGQENPQGDIGFYDNQYCSDPALQCDCQPQVRRGCIPGQEDVYWFDSCGNEEGVAEDCDFTQNTLCGEVNGTAICRDLNCPSTQFFPNNPHDINIGGPRLNGESWCVYESGVGEFRDRPGSRHFRHYCFNGEEMVEACRDFREEICIQADIEVNGETFTEANCFLNEIYSSAINSNVSQVPLGSQFWESVPTQAGPSRITDPICDAGSFDCVVLWVKADIFSSWECEQNCECEEQQFIDNSANYCKSLGDCGADINILDQRTTDGFEVTWEGANKGPRPTQVSEIQWQDWQQYGIFGNMIELQEVISLAAEEFVPGFFSSHPLTVAALAITVVATTITLAISGLSSTLGLLAGSTAWSPVGIVIAVIVILLIIIDLLFGGSETAEKTVTLTCQPWQAPTIGTDCEKCDDDPFKECSEYRCRSLGQSCKLVNEGTNQAECINMNPNDVNAPIILPWPETLTQGFSIAPTATGYLIQPTVPAFTPITFGIQTDEPAQCRISAELTNSFEEMTTVFGGALYTQEKNVTLTLAGGETYRYYLRCRDALDNSNVAPYTVEFTTDPSPDLTPPNIESTSILNNAYMTYAINQTALTLYLNEPAQCKWSKTDQVYDTMENSFICDTQVIQNPTYFQMYECSGVLTDIQDNQNNRYYFRCKDLADNENQQSYEFNLQGTVPLTISSIGPSGSLYYNDPTLSAVTQNGAEQGVARCEFSQNNGPYIEFLNTNSNQHTQPFSDLQLGSYTFDIQCSDVAGNTEEAQTQFTVEVDQSPPEFIQIYRDTTSMFVVTQEDATCRYSTTDPIFEFTQGTLLGIENTRQHSITITEPIYYIICKDIYDNYSQRITVFT